MKLAVFIVASFGLACSSKAAPTWPPGAVLQTSQHQLLYNAPATTEAELMRRERAFGFAIFWPTANGADHYVVDRDGVVVETTKSTAHEGTAEGVTTLRVFAVAADGTRSKPLTSTQAKMRKAPASTGLLGLISADPHASLGGGTPGKLVTAGGLMGAAGGTKTLPAVTLQDLDRPEMKHGIIEINDPQVSLAKARQVLRKARGTIRAQCDMAALAPTSLHHFLVSMRINVDGTVEGVTVSQKGPEDKSITTCLSGIYQKMLFPKPKAAVPLTTTLIVRTGVPRPPSKDTATKAP